MVFLLITSVLNLEWSILDLSFGEKSEENTTVLRLRCWVGRSNRLYGAG